MDIHSDSLVLMRERGGQWAAYRCDALDSAMAGHVQFLKYGENCTYATPPEKCPDTASGLGWKYAFIGLANLESGKVELHQPNDSK